MARLGCRPACACPISLSTTPKPAGVRKPLFSVSAICHIWPRISGGSLVLSKNLTATSPDTAPKPSGSASLSRLPNTRFSSAVRLRFGSPASQHVSASNHSSHFNVSSYLTLLCRAAPWCWLRSRCSISELFVAGPQVVARFRNSAIGNHEPAMFPSPTRQVYNAV